VKDKTMTLSPRERIETYWVVADRLRFLGQLPGTDTWLIETECPPGSGTPPIPMRRPSCSW
jgi:hypothetical protein